MIPTLGIIAGPTAALTRTKFSIVLFPVNTSFAFITPGNNFGYNIVIIDKSIMPHVYLLTAIELIVYSIY